MNVQHHVHIFVPKMLKLLKFIFVRMVNFILLSYCIFFLVLIHQDPSTVSGQRGERRTKCIEENVEFVIVDIGEVEYTPTEGQRTSQDYVSAPKNRSGAFLQLFIPSMQDKEQLIRNRVLRTLYCTTKNESRQRRFLLEVNEQPCDIRPIASEGSTELRYLQSTQNLFDYLLNYGNDTFLYVKLLRGKRKFFLYKEEKKLIFIFR